MQVKAKVETWNIEPRNSSRTQCKEMKRFPEAPTSLYRICNGGSKGNRWKGIQKSEQMDFSVLKKHYELINSCVFYLFQVILAFEILVLKSSHLGLVQRFSTKGKFDPLETLGRGQGCSRTAYNA